MNASIQFLKSVPKINQILRNIKPTNVIILFNGRVNHHHSRLLEHIYQSIL